MDKAHSGSAPSWGTRESLPRVTLILLWSLFATCGVAVATDYYGGNIGLIGLGRNDNTSQPIVITSAASSSNPQTNSGQTVISVGNTGNITVDAGAVVQGNSNSSSGVPQGWGTGPNVIEAGSDTRISVSGTVQQLGNTTDGEAINFHGVRNTLTVQMGGRVYSQNGAAIWFQDQVNGNQTTDRNQVINYGTIATGKGAAYNVFGSSASTNNQPGLVFTNYGTIDGSLRFGNGNDSLTLGVNEGLSGIKSPLITGNIDGGGGTNDLTLAADNALDSGMLMGAVSNFSTITKTGNGTWAIMGSVPRTDPSDPNAPPSPITGSLAHITTVTVAGGWFTLVGANPDFTGEVIIDSGATLSAQTQGISSTQHAITNNGTLQFDQPSAALGDFSPQITGSGQVVKQGAGTVTLTSGSAGPYNSYSGGTIIKEGTLAIDDNRELGSNAGALQFLDNGNTVTQSTLQAVGDLDLTGRTVTLNQAQNASGDQSFGIIDTNGHDVIAGPIDGDGSLVKTGEGTLNLTGASTYAGSTTITGGILDVNVGATVAGTSAGYVDNGILRVIGTFGSAATTTTVFQNGNLDGYADSGSADTVVGNVVNASGNITPGITGDGFNNATENGGRKLTIDGDYTTSQGPPAYLNINTVLGNDGSDTSHLTITGNASGTTFVHVYNQGGLGAQTSMGIDVISTDGSTNDAFRLRGDGYRPNGTPIVTAGDYGYALIKGGVGGSDKVY